MPTVTIDDRALSVDDLLAVVDGARVELGTAAREAIAAARAVVDEALSSHAAVYGLTTQVGHLRDTRLSEEEIRGEQEFLVRSHAGGVGPPLPVPVVRAALAVRLAGIARGGSGASVAAAETLAAMLNAGVHPVVPETGSVGAADIGQMAGMAQVAIGLGRAEHRGEVLDGGEALRRAGIAPLVLSGKDGLALISANGVSVGEAALVVARAERTAEAADVAAALSMEAIRANPSVVHPAVGRARPIPGQVAAADHLRDLLAGSALLAPGGAASVQDPLSFRVVPQVHGALRAQVAATRAAVETELAAAADNPLVSVEDRTLVSNGNFHPMVLALACDALRIGVAAVGQLSDRRLSHLWEAFFRQLAGPPPSAAHGLALRPPAAAVVAELRQLAAPATLDVPPLDNGVEDHATGAPLSARKAGAALDLLADVLAVELLLAGDVLAPGSAGTAPDGRALGTGPRAALELVRAATAAAEPYPDAVHRALRERFPGSHPRG
ncbi:aromatic amino acid ammonia-lyase [Geodermatophilus marinus]|uniref:aromatic amino acid ammonia-lyase n=1 Tax=Geodermatophilus sp. LHW52908 TaxID=2303986 RepID=UPI000E3B5E1A|nr:aromatic amino acid ammonia-lyase [Geodermatophilus sp. LHW52908]RFU23301.1 aromatic amino acid lyase [Geodermatophilus sp. LHW52908]